MLSEPYLPPGRRPGAIVIFFIKTAFCEDNIMKQQRPNDLCGHLSL